MVDPIIIINARRIRRGKGHNHLSKSYMYLTTSRDAAKAIPIAYSNTGRAIWRHLYRYIIGLSILMNTVCLRNFLSKKTAIFFNILFHLQELIEKKGELQLTLLKGLADELTLNDLLILRRFELFWAVLTLFGVP